MREREKLLDDLCITCLNKIRGIQNRKENRKDRNKNDSVQEN